MTAATRDLEAVAGGPADVQLGRPGAWVVVDGERRLEVFEAALRHDLRGATFGVDGDFLDPAALERYRNRRVATFAYGLRDLDQILADDAPTGLGRDLSTAVVTQVVDHPEQHDQSSWFGMKGWGDFGLVGDFDPDMLLEHRCGTTACLAGWTVALGSDAKLVQAGVVDFTPLEGWAAHEVDEVPDAALRLLHVPLDSALAAWIDERVFTTFDELSALHSYAAALGVDAARLRPVEAAA